jgi:hypothetical protein
MARKFTSWQSPLATRHVAEPSGPLADIAGVLVHDYTRQRAVCPTVLGANSGRKTMNASGGAAMADVGSLETHGTGSPFLAPF